MYVHSATRAALIVYVDDLLMVASAAEASALWAGIDAEINFQAPPAPIGQYLGARYRLSPYSVANPEGEMVLAVDMIDYTRKAIEKFKCECGHDLGRARSPFMSDQFWAAAADAPGVFSASCSSYVATLIFLSRVCRPDISAAVRRLCTAVSRWEAGHDRALKRFFAYLEETAEFSVIGSLAPTDYGSVVIRTLTDSDLSGGGGGVRLLD